MVQDFSKEQPLKPDVPVMITRWEYWKQRWGRRFAIWGGSVLVLAILLWWLGPRALGSLKAWRAHKLVDFAAVHKKAGNTVEMKNLLLQAYRLARDDEKVLRAMAADYASNDAETLKYLQRLACRTDASPADRMRLCRLALDSRYISYAAEEFERLLRDPENQKDPEKAELIARYLALKGETDKVVEWTASSPGHHLESESPEKQTITTTPGSSAALNLIRAKLLLDSAPTDEGAIKKAAADVAALLSAVLADGNDREQREAALLLARLYVTMPTLREILGDAKAGELLQQLEKWSAEPKWEARLVAADLQIFLKPDIRNAVVAKLIEDSSAVGEPGRLELARWLNARQLSGEAQTMAEEGAGNQNVRDWYFIRLDAMASQKKWQEIELLLVDQTVPIEEILRRLFLWRCALELKLPPDEIERRRVSILEASKKAEVGADFFVAGYLEKMGDYASAASLYQKHTEDDATANRAFMGLVRSLGADMTSTEALRDALETMLARYPQVNEARNDLAYLNLLEGEKINESFQVADRLVNASPQPLAYRTTLALAHLLRGELAQAGQLYEGVHIDWSKVTPGWTAVRAAVLGAQGRREEAEELARSLNGALLREGEKKLLERFVSGNPGIHAPTKTP